MRIDLERVACLCSRRRGDGTYDVFAGFFDDGKSRVHLARDWDEACEKVFLACCTHDVESYRSRRDD